MRQVVLIVLLLAFCFYSSMVYLDSTNLYRGQALLTGQAKNGKLVFQKYNCVSCHQIYGLGGYMGPDLTNVISNRGKLYATALLINGTDKMPDFNLSKQELSELIAFLEYVDKTGTSPPLIYEITRYGGINIHNDTLK